MGYYRKKPVVVEAKQLKPDNIHEIQCFIEQTFIPTNGIAREKWEDYLNIVRDRGGIMLKTPESDGETQLASFGDFIFKAHTEKLGWHFYPVKPDYVEQYYEVFYPEPQNPPKPKNKPKEFG